MVDGCTTNNFCTSISIKTIVGNVLYMTCRSKNIWDLQTAQMQILGFTIAHTPPTCKYWHANINHCPYSSDFQACSLKHKTGLATDSNAMIIQSQIKESKSDRLSLTDSYEDLEVEARTCTHTHTHTRTHGALSPLVLREPTADCKSDNQ